MAPARRFNDLSLRHQAYIVLISVAGAVTVGLSLRELVSGEIPWRWLLLAVLTLISGSFTIRLPAVPVALSVSETFVFTSVILFGQSAGTLTVALDVIVISFWSYVKGQRQAPFKTVFNLCALPLTIWLASYVFFAAAPFGPLFPAERVVPLRVIPIHDLVGPLLLFTVVYFLLSSWLITLAISLERQVPAITTWRDNFAWLSLNYFGGASVAALVVSYVKDSENAIPYIIVALLPLLLVLYATYSRKIGRFEDANRHLIQLNSLYISTIETLAMAIDAKDQVTHGHIRRVQLYAVGLAKHIGVHDPGLIRAIEAAALLHDMGKLAVPEYILNKPGPLTPAEFERMKIHASVGADILSSIPFPYPVVPIVRHHHENWDGTGYPAGLKGTDIPVGARILSVVDCFDALTSDRPYRPRLTEGEAIQILQSRRGTMYDPVIVDTFLKVHTELAPGPLVREGASDSRLIAITLGAVDDAERPVPSAGLEDIAASTEEMLALYDLAQGLMGQVALADAADVIAKHLRRIVPASACVFFLYDYETDELAAEHASGENASLFAGLRIPQGQRLTGWVAANRKTIINSDPVLDFGDVARNVTPRFRSCLSTPLVSGANLVGVLTLYSTRLDGFTEDHRRLIEVVARQVSQTIRHALDFERRTATQLRDHLTGLPSRERLERFVASEMTLVSERTPLSVIVIDIPSLTEQDQRRSLAVSENRLGELIQAVRTGLRGADVLFRYSNELLVAILTQTDSEAALLVGHRIASFLRGDDGGGSEKSQVLGIATAPEEGTTLNDLVASAQAKRVHGVMKPKSRPPSVH